MTRAIVCIFLSSACLLIAGSARAESAVWEGGVSGECRCDDDCPPVGGVRRICVDWSRALVNVCCGVGERLPGDDEYCPTEVDVDIGIECSEPPRPRDSGTPRPGDSGPTSSRDASTTSGSSSGCEIANTQTHRGTAPFAALSLIVFLVVRRLRSRASE